MKFVPLKYDRHSLLPLAGRTGRCASRSRLGFGNVVRGHVGKCRCAGRSLAPIDQGTVIVNARAIAPVSPNVFGTVALGAGVTAYGARWRRVSAADEFDPRVKALAAAGVALGNTRWLGSPRFTPMAVGTVGNRTSIRITSPIIGRKPGKPDARRRRQRRSRNPQDAGPV